MLAHVDPSWATRSEKLEKMGRSQNTVKTREFLATRGGGVFGGRGCSPSLLRRGENCRTARTWPGDPWPDLSAYARQPARGPTMRAHFVAMLAYVGLSCGQCGPMLWLCWPMLSSCWFMLSQKIRKMGTAKKRCKTQEILMVGGLSWGYVGPSWGYVGLSWGQCEPILGLCWPILRLCWLILGLCWPILGLCCPILGLCCPILGPCWRLCWPILRLCCPILGPCWPILGAMLAHLEAYVGPCWPILSHKIWKMGKKGKSTKHRKTR